MTGESNEKEVLLVVSKLKNYIRNASDGMNTSGAVAETLSELVRGLCDKAIERAKNDGRKTVMDRDFVSVSAPVSSMESSAATPS